MLEALYLLLSWDSRSPAAVVQEICKASDASEARFPLPRSQYPGLSKGKTQPAPTRCQAPGMPSGTRAWVTSPGVRPRPGRTH